MGQSQRDLFYDYVDRLRNREEKEIASIQSQYKQNLYDLFDQYFQEGIITISTYLIIINYSFNILS